MRIQAVLLYKCKMKSYPLWIYFRGLTTHNQDNIAYFSRSQGTTSKANLYQFDYY